MEFGEYIFDLGFLGLIFGGRGLKKSMIKIKVIIIIWQTF